jgi:hypothetical protein
MMNAVFVAHGDQGFYMSYESHKTYMTSLN